MTNKIISVASSKGGIGKSTASLGIARALADAGNKVLICDLDFGNACLDILGGVENDVLYTVADLIAGKCSAASCIVKMKENGLFLLPSPVGGTYSISSDEGEALCGSIKQAAEAVEADFVIVDTGAGVNAAANAAFTVSDTVLVVAGHSPVSVRAAESTAQRIEDTAKTEVKLLINSFDTENIMRKKKASRSGMFEIIDRSGIPLIGVIPYDYELQLTGEKSDREYTDETFAAFENIAARLSGENVPLFSGMKKIRKKKKILFS